MDAVFSLVPPSDSSSPSAIHPQLMLSFSRIGDKLVGVRSQLCWVAVGVLTVHNR